jgi:hypothetical protein
MFWMFLVWNVIGCSHMRHVKRLETPEKNHWSALRVFMKEDQKKEFLMYKTRVERDSYLKDQGLWDKYYNIDEKRREEILSYNVQEGWNQEELLMSWGRPYQTQMEPESKNGIGAERWIYKFEEHTDKKTGERYILIWEEYSKTEYKADRVFEREVVIDDYGRPEWTDNIITQIIDR